MPPLDDEGGSDDGVADGGGGSLVTIVGVGTGGSVSGGSVVSVISGPRGVVVEDVEDDGGVSSGASGRADGAVAAARSGLPAS